MNYIDLRSDSITQPTQEMRDAMYTAPVGDDVYGEDPTVKNLEDMCAKKVGKEAGLFVASGTMANQLAIMTHLVRGDEIITSTGNYIIVEEAGNSAVLSGMMIKAVQCPDDTMTGDILESIVNPQNNSMYNRRSLIWQENALSNGKVISLSKMKDLYERAGKHNMPVHLDGARLFNAAISLGVDVKEITQYADSVMVCLSKGLCAPVGSVLCADSDFIEKARKNRQILGGGMRQAGLLAACGIIALDKMVDRLADDHDNAKYIAGRIANMKDTSVKLDDVMTNMVFFKVNRDRAFISQLPGIMLDNGVKIMGEEGGYFRFITSNEVTREDCKKVCDILENILSAKV